MRLLALILLSVLAFGATWHYTEPSEGLHPTPVVRFDTLGDIDYTIHGDSHELEWEIAAKIYKFEKIITDKWLDGPIPSGMRHITIYISITKYNRAYCTITDHPTIFIASNRDHLDETLMHELTHALLMIRYPDLPRWTHEGVASSWDGPGHQKMYQRILAWSRKSGTYPKLNEIMRGVRFNSRNSTAYTASNSLVKFLLSKNDRYTLYMYATGRITIERAYGFGNIYELQREWVKWLNTPCIAQKPYQPVAAQKPYQPVEAQKP